MIFRFSPGSRNRLQFGGEGTKKSGRNYRRKFGNVGGDEIDVAVGAGDVVVGVWRRRLRLAPDASRRRRHDPPCLLFRTARKRRAQVNTRLDHFWVTASIGYITNKLSCFRFSATIVYCFKMLHLTLFTKEKRRALANPKLGSFIGLKLVMLIKY